MKQHHTDPPFMHPLYELKEPGTYLCENCKQPLFSSEDKYDSGTGWPSFTQPVTEEALSKAPDHTLATPRVEVHCSQCKSHLGHVFPDGPPPKGLRYCINGSALEFKP